MIIDNKVSDYYDHKIPFPYIRALYVGFRAENELIDKLIKIGKDINVDVYLLKLDGSKFSLNSYGSRHSDFMRESRKYDDPFM